MNTLEQEMREWLLDCFTDEYDQEQIRELEPVGLLQAIDRYYDGGVKAFKHGLEVAQ